MKQRLKPILPMGFFVEDHSSPRFSPRFAFVQQDRAIAMKTSRGCNQVTVRRKLALPLRLYVAWSSFLSYDIDAVATLRLAFAIRLRDHHDVHEGLLRD